MPGQYGHESAERYDYVPPQTLAETHKIRQERSAPVAADQLRLPSIAMTCFLEGLRRDFKIEVITPSVMLRRMRK